MGGENEVHVGSKGLLRAMNILSCYSEKTRQGKSLAQSHF